MSHHHRPAPRAVLPLPKIRLADKRGRCGFQGASGTFSHEACRHLRPQDDAIAFDSFEAAIEAALNKAVDRIVISVENSTIGRVDPAATLVEASGLAVQAEVWRPIRLALMAIEDARLDGIRMVGSHPAALGQCRRNLSALQATVREVFDTAGAARAIAESEDRTRAAIAPAGAADLYGLRVLDPCFQDRPEHQTRFLLLGA